MSKEMAKKVIEKIVENVGKGKKVSISRAMDEVGYSPNYSGNPQAFTRTKQARELMAEYLPDELIAQRHSELTNAAQISHYYFPNVAETIERKLKNKKIQKYTKRIILKNEEIREIIESVSGCRLIYVKKEIGGAYAYFSQPDNRSRQAAIDMAYKLKGSYSPEKFQMVKRKYQDLSNAELVALEQKCKDFLLKK